jgi:ABC-2 type transport system permease protein
MPAGSALAALEVRRLFRRPLAWLVLSLNAALLAWFYLLLIVRYLEQESSLRAGGVTLEILMRYFGGAALVMLLTTPILTMNVLANERRDGRLRFLFSAPLSSAGIVLGKLAGVLALASALWLLIALIPITLLWGAPIDHGVYATNALGLALFTLLHVCLGVFASALTRQAVAAGSLTLVASLVLWFADWAHRLDPDASLVGGVSTLSRMRGFTLGLVNAADVAYFLVGALACVLLAVWCVEGLRRYD